jgi:hypothetical protein
VLEPAEPSLARAQPNAEVSETATPSQRVKQPTPQPERRRHPRRRVLHRGLLLFGEKNALKKVACVIQDVSKSGTRIQVEQGTDVPIDVTLVHLRESSAHEAKVAWRRRGSIGLKFVGTCDLKRLVGPELEALRKLTESNLGS